MTNQEAADIIRRALAEIEWEQPMEYAAAFDKAIDVLEAAPAKWISVKKRPPKIGEKVLILSRYGHISSAKYEHYMGEFYFDPFGYELNDGFVTHWRPRPEDPKEDEA